MYGPRDIPPPIEKIRKAQWTVENTRATQAVVDRLVAARFILREAGLNGNVTVVISAAIERLKQLDPKVTEEPKR